MHHIKRQLSITDQFTFSENGKYWDSFEPFLDENAALPAGFLHHVESFQGGQALDGDVEHPLSGRHLDRDLVRE